MPTKTSIDDEAAEQQVPEDERPEVDEDDLDVERDEQQRVDVEREAEAAPGVAERVDARLVGQALVAVAAVAVAEQPRGADREEHERDAGEGEPEHVPDPGQATFSPSSRGNSEGVRSAPSRALPQGRNACGHAGRHARIILAGEGGRAAAGAAREAPPTPAGRVPIDGTAGVGGGRIAPSARASSRSAPRR